MIHQYGYSIAIISALVVLAIDDAAAQPVWLPPTKEATVSVEGSRPFLAGSSGDILSAAWIIATQIPLSPRQMLLVDIPVSHYNSGNSIKQTDLGNPYIGLRFGRTDSRFDARAGIRIPTSGILRPYAAVYGILADHYRYEAFMPRLFTAELAAGFVQMTTDSSLGVKIGVGPMVSAGELDGSDHVLLAYHVQVWRLWEKTKLGMGVTGKSILADIRRSTNDRVQHQFGVSCQLALGSIRPGAHIRVPIGGLLDDAVDVVAGINVTAVIGGVKRRESWK